jgi:ankyrin repeat protein
MGNCCAGKRGEIGKSIKQRDVDALEATLAALKDDPKQTAENITKIVDKYMSHRTALMDCIAADFVDGARLLIDAGASLDLQENLKASKHPDKKTALGLACAVPTTNVNLLGLLLEKGADANAHGGDGVPPLTLLVAKRDYAAVRLLFEQTKKPVDVEVNRVGDGYTPLMLLCEATTTESQLSILKQLLEKKADVNASAGDEKTRKTALSLLATAGSVDAATMLIAKATVAVKLDAPCGSDGGNKTPLHIACSHAASSKGRDGMVQLLVGSGADRNARCDDGKTPLLLLAANAANAAAAAAAAGADATAAAAAAAAALPAMTAILSPLSVPALAASKKLSGDGDVNAARKSDGMSALMLLVSGGDKNSDNNNNGGGGDAMLPLVDLLLSSSSTTTTNVRLNSVNAAGDTALHMVLRRGAIAVLKSLAKFDLDVNVTTRDAFTPLEIAYTNAVAAGAVTAKDATPFLKVCDVLASAQGKQPLDGECFSVFVSSI